MAARTRNALRSAITASVVLAIALAAIEVCLRTMGPESSAVVAPGVELWQQRLLVPNKVVHHELARDLTTTLHHPDGERVSSIRINAQGCRGDAIEGRPAAGVFRILMLGDDTFFGSSVSELETVGGRLHQFLPAGTAERIEIVNGAVPGDCPLLALLRFEQHLGELKPELVILHVDMSDISDDQRYRSLLQIDGDELSCAHPSFQMPTPSQSRLRQFVAASATADWFLTNVRHQSGLTSAGTAPHDSIMQPFAWIADDAPDLRLAIRHALEPIITLNSAASAIGAKLLITTCPVRWQVVETDSQSTISRACNVSGATPFESQLPFEVLANLCSEQSLKFMDTTPAFRNAKQPARLFDDSAPTLSKLGMALYGRELATFLTENPPSRW